LNPVAAESAKGNTLTWSVVAKYPERLLPKLPLGADVRLFANRSENFSPVGARRTVYNELLAPPTGTTKEYGVMLDLFGGKISMRINKYETAARASPIPRCRPPSTPRSTRSRRCRSSACSMPRSRA
jgi:hypothetical protein